MTTISKRDLSKFAKKMGIALGDEWHIYNSTAIMRYTEFLLQCISFDTSRHSPSFVPTYFVMVLPIPKTELVYAIGDRLKNNQNGDYWIEWKDQNDALIPNIVTLLCKQAIPLIKHSLRIDDLIPAVKDRYLEPRHMTAWWSLGILEGLAGHLDQAKYYMEGAVEEIRSRMHGWEKDGEIPPEYFGRYLDEITGFLNNISNHSQFEMYCKEMASLTRSNLGL